MQKLQIIFIALMVSIIGLGVAYQHTYKPTHTETYKNLTQVKQAVLNTNLSVKCDPLFLDKATKIEVQHQQNIFGHKQIYVIATQY